MPTLSCLQGPVQQEFEIEGDRTVIGRNPECQIRIGTDDDGRRISRRHAAIQKVGEHFQLQDLQSRNGTMYNGRELVPFVPVTLRHGDSIQICDFLFAFTQQRAVDGLDGSAQVEMVDGIASSFISKIESSDNWEVKTSLNSESKLRAILQLVRQLHGKIGIQSVVRKTLESLLDVFPAYEIAVAVIFDEGDREPLRLSCCQPGEKLPDVTSISRSIVDHVMTTQQSVVTQNILDEKIFDGESVTQMPWCAVMCVPLVDSSRSSIGILQLQSSVVSDLDSRSDLELFHTVAMQVSHMVETSRLSEAAALQRALVKELEIAQRIQFSLMPRTSPTLDGYSFYEYYSPFQYVGGDYYDYIRLKENRLAIVLADVEGHGIPAAMVMTKLSSEIKIRLAQELPIVEVVASVNQSLVESGVEKFITMLLMVLDCSSGAVEIVNAGHPLPIIASQDGKVREVQGGGGIPVGLLDDQEYSLQADRLNAGELLLAYTDGITDATSTKGQFGRARLLKTCGSSFESNGENVVKKVLAFQGDMAIDDMCLVSIRRDG